MKKKFQFKSANEQRPLTRSESTPKKRPLTGDDIQPTAKRTPKKEHKERPSTQSETVSVEPPFRTDDDIQPIADRKR